MPPLLAVERRPAYHGQGADGFFGWLHVAREAPPRDCVAVICPPIGHEYTRSHRSIRHLADRLARRGIAALRFDYAGTGDSPGAELDADRLSTWIENVRVAAERARSLTGSRRVCVIGVRLGATLAALAARQPGIDLLVLWNPVTKGRAYVRELQAISKVATRAEGAAIEGLLEAAGFAMTEETVAALREIDLLGVRPAVRRVLLVSRDDVPLETSLAAHLRDQDIDHEQVRLPGWTGMMADHQFTVVPGEAIDYITGWVEKQGLGGSAVQTCPLPAPRTSTSFDVVAGGVHVPIEERLMGFGPDDRLFGVLTRRDASPERTAIVLFNAGSVHHVGPNRAYVSMARHFATQGFASLRFDLTGLGDSVIEPNPRENHPYPPTALEDSRAAFELLRSLGYRSFVSMGLCSGAHAAFHSALELDEPGLREVVLINPYTFHWHDRLSLETMVRIADAEAYRQSVRDPARWRKLLRGDVNFPRIFEAVARQPFSWARRGYGAFCERLIPSRAPELARDLRRLFESGRHLSLVIAEGDPGLKIMLRGAPRTARQAIKTGGMHVEVIPDGDHTFTPLKARRELVARLAATLLRTNGPQRPATA